MSRDDLLDVEMKFLKLLQCPGIFLEIGKRQVAKVFLQNRAGVEHFLFGKINEDVVGVVGRPEIEALDSTSLQFEVILVALGWKN